MIISDMYSQATDNQIISGCHYNQAVTADKIILQALFILCIKSFLRENAQVLMVINYSLREVAYAFKKSDDARPVFSYKLRYIVGFWLIEMAI